MAGPLNERIMMGRLSKAVEQGVAAEIERQSYRIHRNIAENIEAAHRSGRIGATNGVKAFAIGIQRSFANPKDLAKAHERVAEQMRESVRRSFGQSTKTRSGQYRVGEARRTSGGFLYRYSGGALKRAISAPSLAVGDAGGISFVDEGRLTREAAHWARLNFGAAPQARRRAKYRILFDERVVATVGFSVGPRPAFTIPPGMWFNTEGKRVAPNPGHAVGQDRFFLASTTRLGPLGSASVYDRETKRFVPGRKKIRTGLDREPTRGIKPKEFLDAGLYRMAKALPGEYNRLLDKWYRDAKKRAQLPDRQRVAPAAAVPLKIRYYSS